jgi:hypothetical protein
MWCLATVVPHQSIRSLPPRSEVIRRFRSVEAADPLPKRHNWAIKSWTLWSLPLLSTRRHHSQPIWSNCGCGCLAKIVRQPIINSSRTCLTSPPSTCSTFAFGRMIKDDSDSTWRLVGRTRGMQTPMSTKQTVARQHSLSPLWFALFYSCLSFNATLDCNACLSVSFILSISIVFFYFVVLFRAVPIRVFQYLCLVWPRTHRPTFVCLNSPKAIKCSVWTESVWMDLLMNRFVLSILLQFWSDLIAQLESKLCRFLHCSIKQTPFSPSSLFHSQSAYANLNETFVRTKSKFVLFCFVSSRVGCDMWQVVQLIRCSQDRSAGGELTLVIRPNGKPLQRSPSFLSHKLNVGALSKCSLIRTKLLCCFGSQ